MQFFDLPAISVASYNKDYLIELIRHKTGWDERHEVSDKKQLNYLCNYLESAQIKCETLFLENEYIDRHYLEDYSEYYAKCFPSHPRMCSRLHFFSTEFDETAFLDGVTTNSQEFINKISENYIGFAVIRPIPHTFLAKLCLKPFPSLIGDVKSRVIRRKIAVSLFGLSLTVETTPFLEQDKVVSACATSALWTALSVSPSISPANLPSPSAITKSATLTRLDSSRTFPTTGLSLTQVATSLKYYGLEPSSAFYDPFSGFGELNEHIFSYVTSGIPIIIGGNVYQVQSNGYKEGRKGNRIDNVRLLGRHLVCAVGCQVDSGDRKNDAMPLLAHSLAKLYIHDDRYGPFVKMNMYPIMFSDSGKGLSGFGISIDGTIKEIFVPEFTIVGLYHKIRIPYSHIKEICESLITYLWMTQEVLQAVLSQSRLGAEEKEFRQKSNTSIDEALKGAWEISLTTCTQVKEEIIRDTDFHSFNGDVKKANMLTHSMPKYMWRCRILLGKDLSGKYTDIYFDATEIPQGHVLVGYATYAEAAQLMWSTVERNIVDRRWQQWEVASDSSKRNISCILKFFNEPKVHSYLNMLYGSVGLPSRALKQGETDSLNYIQKRNDVHIIPRGIASNVWVTLNKSRKYIWVIRDDGDLVLGEDIEDDGDYQGHPTLLDGKPGRIAGEIFYCEEKSTWLFNHKSRAYSGHLKEGAPSTINYMKHVQAQNLVGIQSEDIGGKTSCSSCTEKCKWHRKTEAPPTTSTTPVAGVRPKQ